MFNLNSFNYAFFQGDSILGMEPTEEPKSIRQALYSMSEEDWDAMRKDVFPDSDDITINDVIARIRKTNTFTTVSVEVLIDEEGDWTLTVYE